MPEVSNSTRAEWAREGLKAFEPCVYFGNPDEVEHISTRISDLITNLLHLARLNWDEKADGPFDAAEFAANCAAMHDTEAREDDD